MVYGKVLATTVIMYYSRSLTLRLCLEETHPVTAYIKI